jgi:hypothetical protein
MERGDEMRTLIGMLMVLMSANAAQAQTSPCGAAPGTLVVNPNEICFTSSDHNATEFGQPRISEYRLSLFLKGVNPTTGEPVQTISLGRPAPAADGAIRISRADLGATSIGNELFSTIDEVWSGGVVRSLASNFFGRSNQTAPASATPPVVNRRSP